MRAIAIQEYGGQDCLQLMELPVPQIGPDDVLVRVVAAAVNPADISIREGRYAQRVPLSFPAIMGSDFAGTVAQVGAHVTTVRSETSSPDPSLALWPTRTSSGTTSSCLAHLIRGLPAVLHALPAHQSP